MSLGGISFVLISIGSYLTRCMWIQSKSRGTHLHSPEFTSTHMPSMIHTSPQGKGKATHCQREKDKSETSTFDSFPPSIPPRARTLDTQNETMSRVGPLLLIYLIHFLLLMSPTDLAPRPFPGQSFGLHLFHVGVQILPLETRVHTSGFSIIFENPNICKQITGTHRRNILHAAKSSQMSYTAKNHKI